jgi:hypothetical protein
MYSGRTDPRVADDDFDFDQASFRVKNGWIRWLLRDRERKKPEHTQLRSFPPKHGQSLSRIRVDLSADAVVKE